MHLITPPSEAFLNSTFSYLARLFAGMKPTLKISPADASARWIEHADTIRVFNSIGEVRRLAEVTEDVPRGVVVAEGLWANRYSINHRGINFLTTQRLPDIGGTGCFHDSRVEVEGLETTA